MSPYRPKVDAIYQLGAETIEVRAISATHVVCGVTAGGDGHRIYTRADFARTFLISDR